MPLHPQCQLFLDMLAARNAPAWNELLPAQGREIFGSLQALWGDGPAVARVVEYVTPSKVALRVYVPDTAPAVSPAVLYMHGGGWVLGNIDTHDALCRHLAVEAGCSVASVAYRLSPATKFPGPVDDCFDALRFLADQAAVLGIDPQRLAVAGDSAGGNLAAALALKARAEGGPNLKLQLLLYPVIEPNFESGSYLQFAEGYGLSRAVMIWFWEQYMRSADDMQHPLAVPTQAESLAGLAPAHIVTAEYDVLRDEAELYAQQLIDAGVPTTLEQYDGMLHGFIHLAGIFDGGRQALKDVGRVLRAAL
jgi:acetyl esterase